jgi:DNA polymerase III delta subunit
MKLIPSAEITGSRFIVAGSHFFMDSAVTAITLAQKERGIAETHSYYEGDTDRSTVLNELLTEPFFDDFKLVVFHISDDKKQSKKDVDYFKPFKMDFRAVFIIVLQDVARGENLHKILPGYKLIAEKALKPQEKNRLVQELFAEHKLNISYDDAQTICKALDEDMALVASEAEKLALYYHFKSPKSSDELLSHISGTAYVYVWGFMELFFTRKGSEALTFLSKLYQSREPEDTARHLFYTLPSYYLGIYFRLAHPNVDRKKLSIKENWQAGNFTTHWTKESIAEMIALQRALEFRIKTGGLTCFDALLFLVKRIY